MNDAVGFSRVIHAIANSMSETNFVISFLNITFTVKCQVIITNPSSGHIDIRMFSWSGRRS